MAHKDINTKAKEQIPKSEEWETENRKQRVRGAVFHALSPMPCVSFLLVAVLLIFGTPAVWSATISGTVVIEGREDMSGVLVTAKSDQRQNLSGITDPAGGYSIPDVSPGLYTVIAQKPGCIVAFHSDITVQDGSITIDFQMVPGDLKIDNQINLLDRIVLTSAWKVEKDKPGWNSMLDIYEDGIIDEKDRDLLLSHWGEKTNFNLGSIDVSSEPNGATIFINGANTGKVTPYTFLGMVAGADMAYTITLELQNFPPKTQEVEVGSSTTSILLVPLDKEPPEFLNWAQEPTNLTEDTKGNFRVLVQVVDVGGSGTEGKIPQIDYRIGTDTPYKHDNMTQSNSDSNLWYYDVPEPIESWDAYRGRYVYYMVTAEDIAGNEAVSEEQRELIDDINDVPTVDLKSTFSTWENGLLTIVAEASDAGDGSDGRITSVKFEYSFDNTRWTQIGSPVTTAPYSVEWNTATLSQKVVDNVWIRVTATDNSGSSVEDSMARSFKLDNEPPTTDHDYDRAWHNQSFVIELTAKDGAGIGVAKITYVLNSGVEQEVEINGRSSALVVIERESNDNILEYWSEDGLGNVETRKTLPGIKLDKTPPVFSNWTKNPQDLTENTIGSFRVSVQIADDAKGSGLKGKPQIDYHIGANTQYTGYKDMIAGIGSEWYYDIPRPIETWDAYRGQYIYYMVRSLDLVDNEEIIEQIELIDDINDPPTINITSSYDAWERGLLTIEADAADEDGSITGVKFEYSVDQITWKQIGPVYSTPPYSASWQTSTIGKPVEKAIWIRATANDNNNTTATDIYTASIGIDNQPPVTTQDYDGLWHKADFTINLVASDAEGIGIAGISYILNGGTRQETIVVNGQASATVNITEEGINTLEYWSVDKLGNEESHNKLTEIKLDKSKPTFVDWTEDPLDLTEDSTGSFRISVRAIDVGVSGLAGKVAEFSYRIGLDLPFSNYEPMTQETTDSVWHYHIPEPAGGWDAYRDKYVYYKVRIEDVAGNLGESVERKQQIDDINDPAVVRITSTFSNWERGILTIAAEASDIDGTIANIRFQYSLNRVEWIPIGSLITMLPYSVQWDTKTPIPEVARTVWLRAIATDDDGLQVTYTMPEANSFGVDNQAPTASHDYDGLWHRKDFAINLKAGDGNGIGVASISYRLNSGNAITVPTSNQTNVPVSITTEGSDNVLEYWSTDGLGNEGAHGTLPGIKLDKTAPVFSGWKQDPVDLTEDVKGRFRVSVMIADQGGSGLQAKVPQLDYHVGTDKQYDGYEPMISEDGETWYFEIPEPADTWNANRNKRVYYKVRVEDVAANVAESAEQTELIDSINDAPVVTITSTFKEWEGGQIALTAEASDVDGSVPTVQFHYSTDAVNWTPISVAISAPPYSAIWDTKIAIPTLAKPVWIKAKATDADDTAVSVENIITKSFGIDNQPPTFSDWTKVPTNLTEDTKGAFRAQVNVDDGTGSKVAKVELAYRIGTSFSRAYAAMTQGAGNLWYYDIPEPIGFWDQYRGQILYYKAIATDTVGNATPETPEQQELIDDINDPPRGLITSTYKTWEKGTLTIMADAVDDDGTVVGVQFQFSVDNVLWTNIGAPRTVKPYMATWDSTAITSDADVWLRAVITDDDGDFAAAALANSIGIDNSPPTFANWNHTQLTEDSTESFFLVEVEINDLGSGLDSAQVQLDYRIGTPTSPGSYVGYRNMFLKAGNVWFYEIPRPGVWSSYAGRTLYYRVKAADITGNATQGPERSEYIDPTTGSISGTITPAASWLRNAQVVAQKNGVTAGQDLVSQIDGSYSIIRLRPGSYDLIVTANGYGIDTSMTGIAVTAGEESAGHNVKLYTYTTQKVSRSQDTTVEFRDVDFKSYSLDIDSNTFGQDGKVALGFSGREPTSIPNPQVQLLGKSIGVGFEPQSISKALELTMPRPTGITDSNTIVTFIYDGNNYRLVDRNNIASSDTNVVITITPDDLASFGDSSHQFETLSGTTVFYVLITKFTEPQLSSSNLGILARTTSSYQDPIISTADRKIALVIHGITSDPDDMVTLINALKNLNYYNQVLVFNYAPNNSISTNGDYLMSELVNTLPTGYTGKVDIIAHGMGGLVARRAISTGGDSRIGSLIMLATPNGGVASFLLEDAFASFLKKTSSDPMWTHYRSGWQDMIGGSSFLSVLNSQAGKTVNTHYYSIAASNPSVSSDTANHDGLLYVASANLATFPNREQPLTELFKKVSVSQPSESVGFMSGTRHMGILTSSTVKDEVTTYVQGRAGDVRYERYDGDMVPGSRINFSVTLENVSSNSVFGVVAELSTQNVYIRKDNEQQGIEQNIASYGDISPGGMKSGSYIFNLAPNATIGSEVTFKLHITNSKDNSVFIEEFNVPIGGNLIQIALNTSQQKMVVVNVNKDTARPDNDGDTAVEPGEIMQLTITLKNNSSSSIQSVTATLKSADTRIVGLSGTTQVNMSTTGIEVSYGTMFGNGTKAATFQYVKINDNFTPSIDQVQFTLDIKSAGNFINTDNFNVKVGADIIVVDFDPDSDLKPGPTGIGDIDVDLRNVTASNIQDIEVELVWDPDAIEDIDDDKLEITQINAGSTKTATFSNLEIDELFEGYIKFTVRIEVDGDEVNTESFWYYFGKRVHYLGNWITDDDDDDGIAEPGEDIKFRMRRWNASAELVEDVEANDLDTTDSAIVVIDEDNSKFPDIQGHTANDSKDEYEFTVANAGNLTYGAPSGSVVTATTLQLSGANWIPDAFIGGTLNPNTGQAVVYTITDNNEDTITVDLGAKPAMNTIAVNNNAFKIVVPTTSLNAFQLRGHTVEFTMNVEENGDPAGSETFSMRIGGIIRYLSPGSSSAFMATISDSASLNSANNGNGIPELGETITIAVTLRNVSDNIDVDDVETELDSNDIPSGDIDVDENDYGDMNDGDSETQIFQFDIDEDFEGSTITFTLKIIGDINGVGNNLDLGTDTFVIPVAHTK